MQVRLSVPRSLPEVQHGQAALSGTSNVGDIGVRDIEITVVGSSLGPQGAGYPQGRAAPMANASGARLLTTPLEFAGNSLRISPKTDMAAVLTRTGIIFVWQEKFAGSKFEQPQAGPAGASLRDEASTKEVGHTNLLDILGTPNDFDDTYLTGNKVQPVVFSDDLSRAFVGGNGVVYVIDMLTFKLISTISIPGGHNIVSLASTGSLLFIGEGQKYGSGAGNHRLLVMDINPGSSRYNQVVLLQNTGIEASRYGVTGMTISADGQTLVVAVPNTPDSVMLSPIDPGEILIFDLRTLNAKTGVITAPIVTADRNDGRSGKAPQVITATQVPDHYLIGNVGDYDRGLSTLRISRDSSGTITSADLTAIRMNQPGNAIRRDRLDIQRAQSAVLVVRDGVEYAIVSDDNYHFNDPYWKAMYEAPIFVATPFGPPLAFGGSTSAKKVSLGGKLGVVKDPFGKQGTPEFIGATLPLDGYGIINLSLSADGKVMIGQLKGGFSADISNGRQKEHQQHAWDVDALITAALAMPEQDRLSKHISLPTLAEQRIPTQGWAPPAGTAFANDITQLAYENGKPGDINAIDIKKLIEDQLKAVGPINFEVGNFSISVQDLQTIYDTKQSEVRVGRSDGYVAGTQEGRIQLLTLQDGVNRKVLSRNTAAGAGGDSVQFKDSGILFAQRTITDDEVHQRLQMGKMLSEQFLVVTVTYDKKGVNGQWTQGNKATLTIKIADAPTSANVFFGDRPLANPGYSAMTLQGEVGVGSTDLLDVFKVEQRLKYLGFPVFGHNGGSVNNAPSKLVDFNVDGKFGEYEEWAVRGFYAATHYAYSSGSGSNGILSSVGQSASAKRVGSHSDSLKWLNAYNAPHWVNAYSMLGIPQQKNPHGDNGFFRDNTDAVMEVYSASWVADLLRAQQLSRAAQGLENAKVLINGLAAPSREGTGTHTNGGHSVGMGIDWGFSTTYITSAYQGSGADLANPLHPLPNDKIGWSIENATALANAYYLPAERTQSGGAKNDQAGALRNFLTLYAVTLKDGTANNGTWEDLPIQNDIHPDDSVTPGNESQKVRRALFGSGVQNAQQLAQHVWIGGDKPLSGGGSTPQNHYQAMRKVLDHLGLGSNGMSNGETLTHYNHFHMDIRPPERVDIEIAPQLLQVDESQDTLAAVSESLLNFSAIQELIFDVRAEIKDEAGRLAMWIPDLPIVNPDTQVIIVAAKENGTGVQLTDKATKVLGVCMPVAYAGGEDSKVAVSFGALAHNYLWEYMGRKNLDMTGADDAYTKVTILQQPQYGYLHSEGGPDYSYVMTPNNYKNDKVVASVEVHGQVIKVILYLRPAEGDGWESEMKVCPGPSEWKITSIGTTSSLITGIAQSWLTPGYPNATVTFSNLAGQAVGETTGTSITLDTNAAGHGWYVDATPGSNEEFLPTSRPNEWQAKAGSAAAGKMDMLSVLLHEYGHALGIEHSADAHDLMATTLTPGLRRLPSAPELALMQQLIGEAKTELAGGTHHHEADAALAAVTVQRAFITANNSTPGNPDEPTLPTPYSALGLALLARSRRSDSAAGSGSAGASSGEFDIAANTTLTNGNLNAASGWATQGSVGIGNGAATLNEVGSSQTRLNQVFVLGAQDRFLSFTLSDVALDDQANGPDDAFEVGLLDANSGASLAGSIGLTHSDALLNLQANGAEFAGQGVSHTSNADGSRTYLVDLRGIAAGTAVNLSFNLIGFAANGSHVTLRDVRLQGLAQTRDDVEYALVTDDKHFFNDPSWSARCKVPTITVAPSGAPRVER